MIGAGVALSGRFELRRNLGVEAAATAWDAFDTVLDRRVLIKLLRAEVADDASAVERFHHDMRAAARADSSTGARVLDAGHDQRSGLPYVVFEWLEPAREAEAVLDRPPGTSVAPARGSDARLERSPAAAVVPSADLAPVTPAPARPERQRVAPRGDRGSRSPRVVQILVLLLVLVPLAFGAVLIRNLLQPAAARTDQPFSVSAGATTTTSGQVTVSRPAPAAALASPVPTLAPAVAPAAAAPAQRPTPSPVASGAGQRRRVANTDGIGVALRATPGGDKLPGKGYDEGATVTLLEVQGTWAHIRGDDGREGWVLAVTLVP